MHHRTLHALLAAVAILAMVGLSACKQAEEPAAEGEGEKETAAGQEATGDEATGDEATGDEATGDEATGDEATGDEATDDETTGDDTDPAQPDADPAVVAATGDAPSLDTLAAALPADTLLVATLDMNALVATITPGGDDAIRTDLRKDVGSLFVQHYKFDPSNAPWVGFAAGSGQWMGLVVGGKVATDGMETTQIAGKPAWVVKQGVSVMIDLNGLSVITAQPMAEKLLADAGPRLAAAPHFPAMKNAVAQLGSTQGLTVSGHLDPALVASLGLPIPPAITNLDAIALSLDQNLELVATGTPDEIKALSTTWGVARDTFVGQIASEYDQRQSESLDDQLGIITAKHGVDSLLNAMEPTFEGGVARLAIDPTVFNDSAGLLFSAGAMGWLSLSDRSASVAPDAVAPAVEVVAPPPVETDDAADDAADDDDNTNP